jgi:5'-3' exoribonuclease 2
VVFTHALSLSLSLYRHTLTPLCLLLRVRLVVGYTTTFHQVNSNAEFDHVDEKPLASSTSHNELLAGLSSNRSAAANLKAKLLKSGEQAYANTGDMKQALREQALQDSTHTPTRSDTAEQGDTTEKSSTSGESGGCGGADGSGESANRERRQRDTTSKCKKGKQSANDEEDEPVDEVRLGEDGYKDRYYKQKFGVDTNGADGVELRKRLCRAYVKGLCWVMGYYYQGCRSWDWFYPYHYAPMACDLIGFSSHTEILEFDRCTTPFRPYQQLMAVLPADSRHALPESFRWLFVNESSPILDFYPEVGGWRVLSGVSGVATASCVFAHSKTQS